MSKVMSIRLKEAQLNRLQRLARRLGRTPSEVTVVLLEEALRQAEFSHIEFRDSSVGRQAYLKGSSLAVWEVMMLGKHYGMDAAAVAKHLEWSVSRVNAAFNYGSAYAEEIEAAISDNAELDFQTLSRLLPQAQEFSASRKSNK